VSTVHELRELAKSLSRRMRLVDFVRVYQMLLFYAVCVALAAYLCAKLFSYPFQPVDVVALTLLAPALASAIYTLFWPRFSAFNAAVETDKKLELEDRFASALQLGRTTAPMVAALIEDAHEHTRGVEPKKVFPFELWGRFRYILVPLAATLAVYLFMPELDILHIRRKAQAAQETKRQIDAEAKRLLKKSETIRARAEREKMTDVAEIAKDMEQLSRALQNEANEKKAALAKLSKLSERIKRKQDTLKPVRDISRRFQQTRELTQTKTLDNALRKGDLRQAAEEIGKLKAALKEGKLSEDQLRKLKQELESLARKMKDFESLSAALSKAAQDLDAGDLGGALDQLDLSKLDLEQFADLLAQLELMDVVLADIQDAKLALCDKYGICKRCGGRYALDWEGVACRWCEGDPDAECAMCSGGRPGLCRACGKGAYGYGPGLRGAGRGRGGHIPDPGNPETDFTDTKVKGTLTPGEILASVSFKGVPSDSDVMTDYVETLVEFIRAEEGTLTKEEIPPGYKRFVKHYFDSIRPDEETP